MSYFGICPLRDGAGLVLFLSPSFDPSSGSFVSAAVRRSGESGDITWLVRVVLNRSAVTVCALAAGTDSAINTRHGKAAPKTRARLFRPVAGPALTRLNTPTKTDT
jgi:hypothetical protein